MDDCKHTTVETVQLGELEGQICRDCGAWALDAR